MDNYTYQKKAQMIGIQKNAVITGKLQLHATFASRKMLSSLEVLLPFREPLK